MDSYAHLHVHSDSSLLDGAARIRPLVAEAVRLGMPAIAVTDHGNMHAAASFQREAVAAGIKPIQGIEIYVAPASRHHKAPVFWGGPAQRGDDVAGAGAYTHLTLLAETPVGLRNLFRLSSLASLTGHYRKPRVDMELLAAHSTGVIATTGCPSGEIQTRLRLGQFDAALQAASDLRDMFPGALYVEVMDHNLEIERRVRAELLDIGRRLDLPLLATNDSHYVRREDAKAHDALLCIQVKKKLDDPDRFRFDGDGYYLKSAAEMRELFRELPEACDNTLAVAGRVQDSSEVFAWQDRNPRVPLEPGDTQDAALRREVDRAADRRFPNGLPPEYTDRVDTELGVIAQMGYSGYFLVISDLVTWALNQGVLCRGRGSAAGSLVVYLLRITDIDPMVHRLFFERFINPERVSPPDVDLDIDERYKAAAVQYLIDKWGTENVAQVVTFGTIKTKAAIRDAARVLGHPYALGERLVKALPPQIYAHDIPLAAIIDPTHERHRDATEIRAIIDSDPAAAEILGIARGLEGLIRNVSTHACAVFLSSVPLLDVVPLFARKDDGAILTCWDYATCEDVGAGMKLDVLASDTLAVIAQTLTMILANHGVTINLAELPLDDTATYEMLGRGEAVGVFQFEGQGASDTLRRMRATQFEDICAAGALYRPGPMEMGAHHTYADRKTGRAPVTPIHSELDEPLRDILGDTYGLCIFQETIMAIARKLANYTLGQADTLRRAMGKKKKEILDGEFDRFSTGMAANGYSTGAVQAIWDVMAPFASYAFPRSHAASYGLVSYWTAYLKAHYPAEFMAARMTSVGDKKARMGLYLAECWRMGITVLSPDVNTSGRDFTPTADGIRFGLKAVQHVGDAVVDAIIAAGESHGPAVDFTGWLHRLDATGCDKQALVSLTQAGAFDSLGCSRRGLCEVLPGAIDVAKGGKVATARGQGSLFDDDAGAGALDVTIPAHEWPVKRLMEHERAALGLYVSRHPLDGHEALLSHRSLTAIASIVAGDIGDDTVVTVGGLLTHVNRKTAKSGNPYMVVTLMDFTGEIEVVVFGRAVTAAEPLLVRDTIVFVTGRVSVRDDKHSVIVDGVTVPDLTAPDVEPTEPEPVTISLRSVDVDPGLVTRLRETLARHPGPVAVLLSVTHRGGWRREQTMLQCGGFTVTPGPGLTRELETALTSDSY